MRRRIAIRASGKVGNHRCTANSERDVTLRRAMNPARPQTIPFSIHNGFLCMIWSNPDPNMDFEICGIGTCYRKCYLMLVGRNLAYIDFRVHCVQCTANSVTDLT